MSHMTAAVLFVFSLVSFCPSAFCVHVMALVMSDTCCMLLCGAPFSVPLSHPSHLSVFPAEKLDEMLAGGTQEVVLRTRPSDDFRAATVKQRPTSRRITQAEINVTIPQLV